MYKVIYFLKPFIPLKWHISIISLKKSQLQGYSMLTIAELQNMYDSDKRFAQKSLEEFNTAMRYYNGNQLSEEMKSIIAQRGQVPIVENIFKMIVNKILGYKLQSLTEIQVSGRREQDKPLAQLLNDILRVFNQDKRYDREIALRDKELIMGLGVLELWIEKEQENYTIKLKSIPANSFLIDKYSTDLNALDSRRFHKKLNIDENVARAYDIPAQNYAHDKRAFVIESWVLEWSEKYQTKTWNRYLWNSNGLFIAEERPFKNNSHPFVVGKYAIDEEFGFYGLFRDIQPLQDYINISENRQANMMGSMKVFFEESAVINRDEFVLNASLDNAIVSVRDGALTNNKMQFIQHHSDIATLSQKTEQKRQLAKILSGLNDETLGTAVNRQSGTAIAQRRDAGLMGLQEYIRSCDLMDRILYEKVLDLVQHYFTKEQTFRIVDKYTGERYFSINNNANNTIKISAFDLVYKTQLKMQGREERFAHWVEILKTINSTRPDLIPSLLPFMLRDTDSPIVDDIEQVLEQANKAQEQQTQAQAQASQAHEQILQAQAQASIQKDTAQAQKAQAQAKMLEATTQQIGSSDGGEIPKEVRDKLQISPSDMR